MFENFYSDLSYIIDKIDRSTAIQLYQGALKVNTVISDKFLIKVIESLVFKYNKLQQNMLLNHMTFKLSALDLEIIKDIPQGGNYRDIPLNVVAKSKRLTNLVLTGGRTTLYGRLHYDKPSYTITTLINRPGNGTHVHPELERVLSVREAARLQSFPDNFYFYGNKTQLLKQVGNAVPPLMSYVLACNIIEKVGCSNSLDLFCGAGGLTLGFKKAGIHSVCCTDIEESACITLKVNNPELPIVCGDITDISVKQNICNIALQNNVDIICGGPPCQGFSLAGLRDKNDSRNQLFRDFVDIVKIVTPKVIVFENVVGLLSYNKGITYNEILELFSGLGYNTCARVLNAADYGVPQKRKRVIILCVRKDIDVMVSDLYPTPLLSELNYVDVKNSLFDLSCIPCSIESFYKSDFSSDYIKLMKEEISFEDYITTLK